MRIHSAFILSALMLSTGGACSSTVDGDTDAVARPADQAAQAGDGALVDAAPPPSLTPAPFAACGASAPGWDCATFQVPLDWSAPAGERIPFRVRRLRATTQPSRGHIWMQPGGPGASGEAMLSTAAALAVRQPTLDIFVSDHRGSGGSSWIGCEGEVEIEPACVAKIEALWAGKMRFFGTTAAAHGEPVVVVADERLFVREADRARVFERSFTATTRARGPGSGWPS